MTAALNGLVQILKRALRASDKQIEMTQSVHWANPNLRKFVKHFREGEFLFRQGDGGRTLIVLLRGVVHLVATKGNEEHIAATLEAGQFMGEKSLVSPEIFPRAYGARAHTESVILELSHAEIETVEKIAPDLMLHILKRAFKASAERLDRTNLMVTLLHSSDNYVRLIQLVLYFCRYASRPGKEGKEVLLTSDSLSAYIDMTPEAIAQGIARLEAESLLLKKGFEWFSVPSEKDLLRHLGTLTSRPVFFPIQDELPDRPETVVHFPSAQVAVKKG